MPETEPTTGRPAVFQRSIDSFRVEQAMQKEGMPFLYLETDYSTEDIGQLSTRIQALIEMVGSKEKA